MVLGRIKNHGSGRRSGVQEALLRSMRLETNLVIASQMALCPMRKFFLTSYFRGEIM